MILTARIEEKIERYLPERVPRRTALSSRRRRKSRPRGSRRSALARCRCALPKRSTAFRTTRQNAGAPEGFTVTVREIRVSAGAGFLVALTGNIMTMPGLPKSPAAERIDVDENGVITGMF